MIFSIHQPNYIPYLGYFYKIAASDVFVILDTVQYPRGKNFSARNRIKTPQGECFLTIPVKIPEGKQGKVKYTEINFLDGKWKDKHFKTVEMNYKRAPYFNEIINIYSEVLHRNDKFVELNIDLIMEFSNYLAIKTKCLRLSQLLNDFGNKTQLIIDIGGQLSADEYLSGTGGGKEYNDEKMLKTSGISLIYSNFHHPQYPQLWGDFVTNLSIIDVLFNCGKSAINFLPQK